MELVDSARTCAQAALARGLVHEPVRVPLCRELQNIGRYRRMMSYVRIAQYERHTPPQGAGLPSVRSHAQATRELDGIGAGGVS